jgi:hypothetical protein
MPYTTLLISMPGGSEWLLLMLFVFPLYFIPTIIAKARKNPNTLGIFMLNLFLGWTFLGWIGALIWAFSSGSKQAPTVIVNNTSQSYSQEYKAEKPDFLNQIKPDVANTKLITHQDKIDQLRQLKQLLDEGILTNEEFNQQKTAILGQ